MDMYALGRMTRPKNKNMIILAGMNHIERYRKFFTEEGWETELEDKQLYEKCSEVPLSIFQKGVTGRSKKRTKKNKKK